MALPQRQKKKQSRISLLVSVVLHVVLGVALFIIAAREGILGKKMKEISAVIVPKEEKKPEPAKPKEEPKTEPRPREEAKAAPPRTVAAPPAVAAAPPPSGAPAAAAPPPAIGADFDFNDGAKAVQTTSDPIELYKQTVEYAFRSKWQKPDGIDDAQFVAEAEVNLTPDGTVTRYDWKTGSGNPKWDASVREALAQTKNIGRKAPKGFPGMVRVRFDTVVDSEPVQ
jgi:hypothetical protein